MIRTKRILVRQKDIWQLGLGSIFQEIQPFLNIYLLATHVIILPLRIFIFSHMVAMILIIIIIIIIIMVIFKCYFSGELIALS